MVRAQPIDSLAHEELEPYRSMKWQAEHRQRQIFVAEGVKVVTRLLESNFPVVSLLLPEKWLRQFEPLLARRQDEDIRAFIAEKKVLETLTGFSMYQGVLAVGKIPPLPTLEDVLQRSLRPRFFAAIEGLSNAENVGGIVRSCLAFGAQALLVGETSASPYLRRAVRGSMGAIFKLPVVEPPSLAEALGQLRRHGIRCIAAHPHADKKTLAHADLTADCCLVFGSEGDGLTPAIVAACDEAVSVPMQAGVDSLNVGGAGAVFLYEAARQRGLV